MAKNRADEQKYPIDSAWFFARLDALGRSMRALARHMDLDPSAVSRMLNGERQMSAEEQDILADFLGVQRDEIAAHRGRAVEGFGEMAQEKFESAEPAAPQQDQPLKRHPAWGVWKGKVTLLPDVDYTAPADPDWGKVYDE